MYAKLNCGWDNVTALEALPGQRAPTRTTRLLSCIEHLLFLVLTLASCEMALANSQNSWFENNIKKQGTTTDAPRRVRYAYRYRIVQARNFGHCSTVALIHTSTTVSIWPAQVSVEFILHWCTDPSVSFSGWSYGHGWFLASLVVFKHMIG